MGFVQRLESALRVAAAVLAVVLVAAVVGGILTRPPAPIGYAAVEGRTLARATGTGPGSAPATVRFGHGAIGVALRCDGHGIIRVVLQPFGWVESPCQSPASGGGDYVLSDVSSSATSWQVQTASENRWSLVLTQPLLGGGSPSA